MKLLRPEHHLEEEEDSLKGRGDDVAVDDDISHEGSRDGDTNGVKEERGRMQHLCLHRVLAPHWRFAGKSDRDFKHLPLSIDNAVSCWYSW